MNEILNAFTSISMNGKLSPLYFSLLFFAIIFAATKLAKYAEAVTLKTKVGGAFIGGVLVAGVTSFPELITEISQAALGRPDIGLADDMGSNFFSTILIAITSLALIHKSWFLKTKNKNIVLPIYMSTIASIIALIGVSTNIDFEIPLGSLKLSIWPLLLFLLYLGFVYYQYKYVDSEEEEDTEEFKDMTKNYAIAMFAISSLAVLLISFVLNMFASVMEHTFDELNGDTIGGIFLSISTSGPEIIAFLILLKKNQHVLAMGALVGSHMLNLSFTFVGDFVFYQNGSFNPSIDNPVSELLPISLGLSITMILLSAQVYFSRFVETKFEYSILPIATIFSYISIWIFVLFL